MYDTRSLLNDITITITITIEIKFLIQIILKITTHSYVCKEIIT